MGLSAHMLETQPRKKKMKLFRFLSKLASFISVISSGNFSNCYLLHFSLIEVLSSFLFVPFCFHHLMIRR